MEIFGAFAGMALIILALAFLFNGFPSINITRNYDKEDKSLKKKK
jgi:hypothetical protein